MAKKSSKIRLGVNIDHCATLRQVRGGMTPYPDLVKMAKLAVKGGAQQITIHLREDRRHIQDEDVVRLCRLRPAEINLEMAATPEMLKIALKQKPDWVCFVPEKRAELTTEGGLDLSQAKPALKKMIPKLQAIGIEVSLFIDSDVRQVKVAAELGAEAVEFHTGHWAECLQVGKWKQAGRAWERLTAAAELAHRLGLRVHAGHGLDYDSSARIRSLPHLVEVNIGHSLVCYALEEGLQKSVRRLRRILDNQKI